MFLSRLSESLTTLPYRCWLSFHLVFWTWESSMSSLYNLVEGPCKNPNQMFSWTRSRHEEVVDLLKMPRWSKVPMPMLLERKGVQHLKSDQLPFGTTITQDVYSSINHFVHLILRSVFNPYLYGNIPSRSTFSSVSFSLWLWWVLCFSSFESLSFRISGRDSF